MKLRLRTLALLSTGLAFVGCKKEESAVSPKPVDSAASKKSIDPDLEQAMAVASARSGAPGATSAQDGGPPPNGIFPPGGADKELVLGQPPKLTLGSEGAEPRVALRPAQPKPGTKQERLIRFSFSNGAQGALPVDFAVTFEALKPKGEEGLVNEIPVQVRINSARIGTSGAPRELEQDIAKLKGTTLEYLVLPDGGGTAYRTELAKGADEALGDIVHALGDTLAGVTLPVPEKPVGVGAYWMVTSRGDSQNGLDLVSYRLVKVARVSGDTVTLDVDTKRYSATPAFDMPGLPPDLPKTMAEFQAIGKGSVELVAGAGFFSSARQESALGATIGSAGKGGARGVVEIRTRAEIAPAGPATTPAALR